MKYLTPGQFKRFASGVALEGVNAMALTMAIAQAESAIDAEMDFDTKIGGFEPHTVWVQGPWKAESLRSQFPNYPVPVRNVRRYRIQVSNLSTTGDGFFANISPNDCVINEFQGYIEIVPLQAVSYSLSPVLLQLGLNPPITQIDCEVGHYIPILGETLTSDGVNKTYYAQRGFWASTYTQALHVQPATLPPVPPVVYKDGTPVSSSAYTVNYTEGAITFNSANSNSAVVTADYTAQIPDYVYFAALAQTAWNIAQRALAAQGMLGLQDIRSGDVNIRKEGGRGAGAASMRGHSPLCDDAAQWLSGLKEIGIA